MFAPVSRIDPLGQDLITLSDSGLSQVVNSHIEDTFIEPAANVLDGRPSLFLVGQNGGCSPESSVSPTPSAAVQFNAIIQSPCWDFRAPPVRLITGDPSSSFKVPA